MPQSIIGPDTRVSSEARWRRLHAPSDIAAVLEAAPGVTVFSTAEELVQSACPAGDSFEVAYDVPGIGRVVEAQVARVRNGISANYPEPYVRRRDPESLVVADDQPTDKPRYLDRFGEPFEQMRAKTLEWLAGQELAVFAFRAGGEGAMGIPAMVVAPANAGFFAFGLAMLQGILPIDSLPEDFAPRLFIFVAPPFRHTHFGGRQVVVHNRIEGRHELFSYNLYPGPSAKKGVYGGLIHLGEQEGWVTAHCSTVQVVTPYDNIVTIMHEGASGGGKSEMLEMAHRESDGRMLLGRNLVTNESRYLEIPRLCELNPVTDDMALCHPSLQGGDRKLWVTDAEDAWFVRVNHIREYATDPELERLTANPPTPLLFLNIDAVPRSRAMIWEHTEDAPGQPCPNPRVVLPRRIVPRIVEGAVPVDIRSLGLRTPPCTRQKPSFGILGLFHILPPALAWLWRLVAPRGHANPSVAGDDAALVSEGVGSYGPFATGRQVEQANLLLRQIEASPSTRHVLIPNQHVGSWYTGFSPQWIAREYLARRGSAKFRPGQLEPSACPLLGYRLYDLIVEGRAIPRWFLQVHTQPEVGEEAFHEGARILAGYFRQHLEPFLQEPDLDPFGRRIIEACLANGSVADYEALFPRAESVV